MLRLFVGNIPHACGEAELRQWLEEHARVSFGLPAKKEAAE